MKARVKDWESHQHYKKRTPPWIKLHRSLLDDYDFHRLPTASRALAPMLWLLASENEGEVDIDPEFLSFRLRISPDEARSAVKPLILNGWLLPADNDSEVLAECKQSATPETEGETEGETETEQEPTGSSPAAEEPQPEPRYEIPLTRGKTHPVFDQDIEKYRELFPAVDVDQSIRAMLAWLDSNPNRRSGSVRGAKQRMTSWLTRDQDKASRKTDGGQTQESPSERAAREAREYRARKQEAAK